MKLIDLSHPLVNGQPEFPGDPKLSIISHSTIAVDRCNVSRVTIGTHQGTHLDAMNHVLEDGRTIDRMPLEWFYGPARVLRMPKAAGEEISRTDLEKFEAFLSQEAKIVLETGWWREFGKEGYFENFPSLTEEAANYLLSRGIRLLGLDTPGPGHKWYELHHILLGNEIVLVENLTNFDQVPDDFILIAFPLNFHNRDGSPVRAVAQIST